MGVDAAGNAVVTFVAANAAPRTLRYATKPAGGPWSAADDLSDPAEGVASPFYDLVVTPGGQATVAWQLYLPLPTTAASSSPPSVPPGGTFGEPETISSATTDTWEPALAVNAAGVATATWYQDNATGGSDIKAATRTADGTWSAAQDVSAAGGYNVSPDVVVDSAGTSTAVWTRSEVGQLGKLHYSSRPAGGTWSAPQDLTPPATGGYFSAPGLAIDTSDRIAAAYVTNLSSGFFVTATTRAPGEPWAAGVPLSPSGDGYASEPEVAMDAAGQATVIWLRNEALPATSSRRAPSTPRVRWPPVCRSRPRPSVQPVTLSVGGGRRVVPRLVDRVDVRRRRRRIGGERDPHVRGRRLVRRLGHGHRRRRQRHDADRHRRRLTDSAGHHPDHAGHATPPKPIAAPG